VICSYAAGGQKHKKSRGGIFRHSSIFSGFGGLLRRVFLGGLSILLASTALAGPMLTLEQLRADPDLTPERFIQYFSKFEFKLGDKVQSPEVFLASRSGDCDDFASLAATVLREKKYTTRLIVVFMDGQTHVVCYVEEIKGYLDYNNRQRAAAVQATNGDLEDIANQVAAWFHSRWSSVSEFSYQNGERRFERIAFH
jgi:hypothetical protein